MPLERRPSGEADGRALSPEERRKLAKALGAGKSKLSLALAKRKAAAVRLRGKA